MEFTKKVIMKPFAKSQLDTPKSKVNKDDSFMRLLLHVARNDGFDEKGRLKYRGNPVPDSDILALINFVVMPLKVPEGLDNFLSFLIETEVDKSLIPNQSFLDKLILDVPSIHSSFPSKTIITPVPKKTYHYAPVVQAETVNETANIPREEAINIDPIQLLETDQAAESSHEPFRHVGQRSGIIAERGRKRKTIQPQPLPPVGRFSARKSVRERKSIQRYGAGWFIP